MCENRIEDGKKNIDGFYTRTTQKDNSAKYNKTKSMHR